MSRSRMACADGDKIVIDGADKLREGAKVTLPNEKGCGGSAQAADKDSDRTVDDHRQSIDPPD